MRFLKVLIILPFLVYGGIKGYLWYDMKSSMDKFTQAVSPFVDVSYGSIFSSMRGEVGIEKIVIRPKITGDKFELQSLSFSAPSILDILTLGSRMKKKHFPEYVGVHVKQLKLDLDSKLFAMLENAQEKSKSSKQPTPLFFESIDALGCGNLKKFSAKDFVAMGANPLKLDLDMILKYQDVAGFLKIVMNVNESNRYRLKIESQVPFDPNNIRSSVKPAEFPIQKTHIEYTDTGAYKLRNQYCARQIGGSVNDYVEAHISKLSQELGAALPEKTIEAYRQFMLHGGHFMMNLNPADNTLLTGLQFYKPADVLNMLGVDMAINNVPVELDQIKWNGQSGKPYEKVEAVDTANQEQADTITARATPPTSEDIGKEKQYRVVKVSQLSRFIGKNIQLKTSNGRQRHGILKGVEEERIQILMRFGGGEFTFPVKIAEITEASVFM